MNNTKEQATPERIALAGRARRVYYEGRAQVYEQHSGETGALCAVCLRERLAGVTDSVLGSMREDEVKTYFQIKIRVPDIDAARRDLARGNRTYKPWTMDIGDGRPRRITSGELHREIQKLKVGRHLHVRRTEPVTAHVATTPRERRSGPRRSRAPSSTNEGSEPPRRCGCGCGQAVPAGKRRYVDDRHAGRARIRRFRHSGAGPDELLEHARLARNAIRRGADPALTLSILVWPPESGDEARCLLGAAS
jgi:hypothetical protein